MRNVNHKIHKYADVPKHIPIYFVVDGEVSDDQIDTATLLSGLLHAHANIKVISFKTFIATVTQLTPLTPPVGARLVLKEQIEQK